MKNKQMLQEIGNWEWEFTGYQKAANLIDERLTAINKKNISSAINESAYQLHLQVQTEKKKLAETVKLMTNQKNIVREQLRNHEVKEASETTQLLLKQAVSEEQAIFSRLKTNYQILLHNVITQYI